jgi:hypothetical protein
MEKNETFQIGKNYLIRTVSHIDVGKLLMVGDKELVLTNASWIADTGRFSNCLRDGFEEQTNSEIEPFPTNAKVIIGRGSIIDMVEYTHKLPKHQK